MLQSNLFPTPPTRGTLRIDAVRTEPRLWIQRLVIWKSPDHKVREVPFHAGINIVWAPDRVEQADDGSTRRAAGHDAGKSVLCRLIRFCLGEATPGDEAFRRRLLYGWRHSWVGIEVRLDGQPWSVLRSLGGTREQRAAQGIPLEQLLEEAGAEGSFETWLKTLESTLIPSSMAGLFPDYQKAPHAWLFALAWMSRDQESGLKHPLEWRAAAAQSSSPVRSSDIGKSERATAVRLLLGAGGADEHAVGKEIEDTESRRSKFQYTFSRLNTFLQVAHEQVAARLGEPPTSFASAEFALSALQNRLEALPTPRRLRALSPEEGRLEEVLGQLELLQTQIVEQEKEKSRLEATLAAGEQQLALLGVECPKLFQEEFLNDDPICDLCKVPISRVRAEGCKLSDKLTNVPTLRMLFEENQKSQAALKQSQQDAQQALIGVTQTLEEIRTNQKSLKQEQDRLNAAIRQMEVPPAVRERLQLEAEISQLRKAMADFEGVKEDLQRATNQLDRARKRRSEAQAQHSKVLERFEQHYDRVVAAMLGTSAEGKLHSGERGFEPQILMGGEKTSVTYSSLKTLAFDVAALLMSMEAGTSLPGMLIHDCPRETDMGDSLYHQLFEVLAQLQGQFGEAIPFQYIITTTSAPPAAYQKKPWTVLELNALHGSERLLTEDL